MGVYIGIMKAAGYRIGSNLNQDENILDAILTEDEQFYLTTEDGQFYLQLEVIGD